MLDQAVEVLRLAALIVGGLLVYTAVTLAAVAWFGARLKRLQSHRPLPQTATGAETDSLEELEIAS